MATDDSTQGTLWGTSEPLKRCTKCGKEQPLENFRPRRDCQRRQSWCNGCQSRYRVEWGKKNRERLSATVRNGHRKRRYGITPDEYARLLQDQLGVCAICRRSETRKHGAEICPLAVDHDHETGKVRGLLCHKCNVMLGCSGDRASILFEAAAYLRRHGCQ